MKKLLLSFVFMLSVGFIFGQAQELSVTNFTGQTMIIYAGASDNGCLPNEAITDMQSIPPGATATFQPILGPNASWVGFKALDNVQQPTFGGRFHNPCVTACDADDIQFGVSASWDVFNSCFRARIF